ncbi:hypothetical protein ACQ4M3_08520 [Leptolyngbya sp. AN03gr2]|uniref:hypothetical protein n=1 Tax=unclassified Leptolyngbya TaxID=2650499 RepID=UPI003D31A43F
MTNRTKQSKALERAQARIEGMKSTGALIDLGNGVSLQNYVAKTEALRKQVESYNALIQTLEQTRQNIAQAEQELNDFSEHMLLGVAALYGKQSKQYEYAGGTRKQTGGWIDRN